MSQETDMRIQQNPRPLLPVARVHAGVHFGGGGVTPVVGTNEGLHIGEISMDSREFTPMDATGYRGLALFLLGAVGAWWMRLGRDFHWMMRNEGGTRILPPQIPEKQPKIWRFRQKTLKFWSIRVNIHTLLKRPLVPRSRRVNLCPAAPHPVRGTAFQCFSPCAFFVACPSHCPRWWAQSFAQGDCWV